MPTKPQKGHRKPRICKPQKCRRCRLARVVTASVAVDGVASYVCLRCHRRYSSERPPLDIAA